MATRVCLWIKRSQSSVHIHECARTHTHKRACTHIYLYTLSHSICVARVSNLPVSRLRRVVVESCKDHMSLCNTMNTETWTHLVNQPVHSLWERETRWENGKSVHQFFPSLYLCVWVFGDGLRVCFPPNLIKQFRCIMRAHRHTHTAYHAWTVNSTRIYQKYCLTLSFQ